MDLIYTGVGSRHNVPVQVRQNMQGLSRALAVLGWVLRSGGAEGSDTYFEEGCTEAAGKAEIYLHRKLAGGHPSPLYGVCDAAKEMASKIHPVWSQLTEGSQLLHARNCYQVLGKDLATPAQFLACWTPDGCETRKSRTRASGGTATAIIVAEMHDVPVFNLHNDDSCHRLNSFLAERGIAFQLTTTYARPSLKQVGLF